MKTKLSRKQSVLIPARYPGEVSPDEAVAALSFFVLRITLYASSKTGTKAVAEQRTAYFLDSEDLQETAKHAGQLGWGVVLDVGEFGVTPPPGEKLEAKKIPDNPGGPWLRFMFRLAGNEVGKIGRVLAEMFGKGMAFYFEPWPEVGTRSDCAVYVKAEVGNRGIVLELASGAGLVPVSVTEVSGI